MTHYIDPKIFYLITIAEAFKLFMFLLGITIGVIALIAFCQTDCRFNNRTIRYAIAFIIVICIAILIPSKATCCKMLGF